MRTRRSGGLLALVVALAVGALFVSLTGGQSRARTAITLYPGFNEIIWTGDSAPVADALAPIAGAYDAVFAWNNLQQAWTSYLPALPASLPQGLTTLETGRVYWIHATAAASLPTSGGGDGAGSPSGDPGGGSAAPGPSLQPSAGVTDPTLVLEPAALPLQPVGVPFVDPMFGTTLRRVSDSSDRGGFETQIYNQLQAFSFDNAYLLLDGSEGYLVRRVADLSRVEGLVTWTWNAPRWHPTRAHIVVHFDSNDDATVRLQYTDVKTLVTTTVFTFPSEYQYVRGNQSFDELSHDGRWVAGMLTRADGASVIFSLDLERPALGAVLALPDLYASECEPDPEWGELEPDWIGVSPLGTYLVVQWVRDDTIRCSGLETLDIRTGAFVGRLQTNTSHGDLGLSADGLTEIFMTTEFYPPDGSDGVGGGDPRAARHVHRRPAPLAAVAGLEQRGPHLDAGSQRRRSRLLGPLAGGRRRTVRRRAVPAIRGRFHPAARPPSLESVRLLGAAARQYLAGRSLRGVRLRLGEGNRDRQLRGERVGARGPVPDRPHGRDRVGVACLGNVWTECRTRAERR